ncbi:MAG TPA: 2-oxo acid dehydrogenase subunit E2 [Streptosporangiaceae bacterium]
MADFLMPSLGADMDEGTLLEWLVKPGDEVHKGDVIAVVDTDKAAIEVESFASGTVQSLIVEPGTKVPVGTVLATIGEPAGRPVAGKPEKRAAKKKTPAPEPARAGAGAGASTLPGSPLTRHLAADLGVDLATVPGTGHGGAITRADVTHAASARAAGEPPAARRRISPLARRVAADLGVDLAAVTGTGPDGSVREADVRRAASAGAGAGAGAAAGAVAAAAQPAAAAPQDRLAAMRQVTARLMARSKREIPHYYLRQTIDLAAAMTWLHDRNRELEVAERLVPAALLLKATAVAARQVPALNGYWTDDQFVPGQGVQLGVAISLRGGGLVTPAIHDAADLTPAELMGRLRDLVTRARTARLRGSELTDATITVTNLGDQGVDLVYGVIYPPQVALVGFGKVAERPFAAGGMVGARPVVIATLAADHRATDGYTGARFLAVLSELLQRPEDM